MNAPGQLRGEFQDRTEPDRIAFVRVIPLDRRRFVVRVPLTEASRIEFYDVKAGDLNRDGVLQFSMARIGSVEFPDIEKLQ